MMPYFVLCTQEENISLTSHRYKNALQRVVAKKVKEDSKLK